MVATGGIELYDAHTKTQKTEAIFDIVGGGVGIALALVPGSTALTKIGLKGAERASETATKIGFKGAERAGDLADETAKIGFEGADEVADETRGSMVKAMRKIDKNFSKVGYKTRHYHPDIENYHQIDRLLRATKSEIFAANPPPEISF